MNKNLKSTIIIVALGVMLFAVLMNVEALIAGLGHVVSLLLPVLLGLLTAFILNVPVTGIEHQISRCLKGHKQPKHKMLRLISLSITLLSIALILIVLFTSVIPEIVRTCKGIYAMVEMHWPEWIAVLKSMDIDTTFLVEWLNSVDLKQMIQTAASGAGTLIGSVANAASSTITWITQFAVALVLAVYVLLDREILARQSKKFLYACFSEPLADRICRVAKLIQCSYTKYLSGQCMEALILGLLILIAFLIFGIPYAWLVAMVTTICALIPYIGATVSCVVAILLTLLAAPQKALLCLIVYLAVQFVETQFIYPHVVGGTVGLSPFWTLIAVLVGGKVCGFFGVVFFIPLTAALYILIRDTINSRLAEKGISKDKWDCSHNDR